MAAPPPRLALLVIGAAVVADLHYYTAVSEDVFLVGAAYTWTFIGMTVAALAAWPWLRIRRVTSLGLAVTGAAVVVTSALLLYWDDGLKRAGLLFWMHYWHSVWSWAFTLLAAAHLWRNRLRFLDFAHALVASRVAAVPYFAGIGAAALLGAGSWVPRERDAAGDAAYAALVDWTLLAVAAAVAVPWLGAPLARRWTRGRRAGAVVERVATRKNRRIVVDVTMLVAVLPVVVTGFVLVYGARPLGLHDLRWAMPYWHTATGAALFALIVAHVAANARPMVVHARRAWRELRARRE